MAHLPWYLKERGREEREGRAYLLGCERCGMRAAVWVLQRPDGRLALVCQVCADQTAGCIVRRVAEVRR